MRGIAARAALLAVLGGCAAAPPLTSADARRDAQVELNQRAARAVARGELARAAAMYRESLRLAQTLEDFRSIAINALNLATVLQGMGEYLRAHQALEEILAAPERYEPRFVAQAAGRRAAIALEERRLTYAAEWLARAESACPADCTIGIALLNLRAHLLLESGAPGEAEPLLTRALAASRAAADRDEEANALRLMGRLRAAGGDPAAGGEFVLRALAIDKALARPAQIAHDLLLLADMALAEGRREAAHDFAMRSLNVARAYQRPGGERGAGDGGAHAVSASTGRSAGTAAPQAPAYARWVSIQAGHLALFLEALARIGALRNKMVRLVYLRQVYQMGVQGLPTIALLAAATGTLLVVEATELLGAGNAYVYELVGWLLVTEAAPLLVAIVFSGRSATVVATELALLKVRGEVRSLERMRIDVVDYLVVPRIAALTVSLMAATLYYEVIAIAGGFGAAALFLQVSYEEQTRLLIEALSAGDLMLTAVKTVLFGLLIGTVACHAGLNAGATVEEVPLAQVKAFMRALTYVILTDVLFALPSFV